MTKLERFRKDFGKVAAFILGLGLIIVSLSWFLSGPETSLRLYDLEEQIVSVEMEIEELREAMDGKVCLDASDTPQCVPVALVPEVETGISPVEAVTEVVELPPIIVEPEPVVVKEVPRAPLKARRAPRNTAKHEPFHTYWGF